MRYISAFRGTKILPTKGTRETILWGRYRIQHVWTTWKFEFSIKKAVVTEWTVGFYRMTIYFMIRQCVARCKGAQGIFAR
jgi:hypothetical protein